MMAHRGVAMRPSIGRIEFDGAFEQPVSEKPARVLMTVSPPGHEQYFEELSKLAASGPPGPMALADRRSRYHTDRISILTTRAQARSTLCACDRITAKSQSI